MKRSDIVELIAEALLTLYGGDADEWEEVREPTIMARLKMADTALKALEKAGIVNVQN